MNFGFRKYAQKCMSRRSQVFAICDCQMCLRMPQFLKFSCRMHPRLEIRSPRAIFSRSCVKFNDPLRSGLVGVGPHYALFFCLLRDTSLDACMTSACLSPRRMVVSPKTTIEEWPCYQRNQIQSVSRRRVLRTPPPLSCLERGVPQSRGSTSPSGGN